MCGRVWLAPETDLEKYQKILADKFSQEILKLWKKTGEFYPSDLLLAIDNRNNVTLMKWGYDIFNRKVINTRIESIRDKKIYTSDYISHRCLIPASGFYEWDRDRNKVAFSLPDSGPLFLAGIYTLDRNRESFVILTTSANRSMEGIHDRMPIILTARDVMNWLFEPDRTRELLHKVPPKLTAKREYEQISLFQTMLLEKQ